MLIPSPYLSLPQNAQDGAGRVQRLASLWSQYWAGGWDRYLGHAWPLAQIHLARDEK